MTTQEPAHEPVTWHLNSSATNTTTIRSIRSTVEFTRDKYRKLAEAAHRRAAKLVEASSDPVKERQRLMKRSRASVDAIMYDNMAKDLTVMLAHLPETQPNQPNLFTDEQDNQERVEDGKDEAQETEPADSVEPAGDGGEVSEPQGDGTDESGEAESEAEAW